ncbi:small subunit processome component 20 homolog isoform X3 [Ochlerotatus camptorhynchus]|uniref:small subunit processome component 20 homolog isoform X3 n=1 Tax=Ochlerotatus camptorhynchus TaxID=644619 RepID=UPI0031E22BCC
MKNRPLKHKAKNAFQFKSFHERISEVDVRQSVLYYVKHENEELEEHQSYFHQTIQKWSVLNLSDEYQRFHAPVRGIVTLSQLLHKKDFVIERLLTSLDSATELSLQALLEFVVILARDLREDFYRFFERIFDKLICLLSTQNPQQLEWTLLCLASLFKIMRGYLRERLDFIFGRIVTLLCDENQLHITNFATECFGFLARDTKKKRELVHMITSAVKHDPTLSTGCGRLLFEIMRGVNQQFHSCASDFWNLLLLEMLNEPASDITGFDPEVLFDILVQTVSDMLQCIASTNLVPFWSSVYQAAESCVANENMVKNEQTLDYILHLIGIAVEHQHGKCVNNCAQMISLLVKIVTRTKSERVLANVTKIATIIMLSRNLNITQLDASRLCKNVMTIGPRSRIVFEDFVLGMVEYAMFENIILPDYLKYFEKKIDTESLNLLTRIVTKKSPRCRHGIKLNCWKQFPIKIKTDHAKRMYSDLLRGCTSGNENYTYTNDPKSYTDRAKGSNTAVRWEFLRERNQHLHKHVIFLF